jgi:predicted outer membrane repeat protein/parallel beta-helix repeat protein
MLFKNRKSYILNFALILALVGGAFGVTQVHAATLTVTNINDSGAGSLRQMIINASAGDTITFDSSLAGQTITLASNLVINKDLIINGSGLSPQVTISGGNAYNLAVSGFNIVTISDLTIANGHTSGNGGGIYSTGDLTLINSTLENNYAVGDGGAIYASDLTMKNTTIYQNQTEGDGGGLALEGNAYFTIVNSTISQNQASGSGGGIFIQGNIDGEISNNTFASNSASGGFELAVMGNGWVNLYNTILVCTSGAGNCIFQSGFPPLINNVNSIVGVGTLSDFGLVELADNGGPTQTMALLPGSSLIDAGDDASCPSTDQRGITRPQGAHCDIGAYEDQTTVRYVKWDASGANDGTSWVDAYIDLQFALSSAIGGDEIWVAAGTYKPTTGTDRAVSFALKNAVAIYGGFAGTETLLTQRDPAANATILSGDIGAVGDNNDNSYHVVVGSNTNSSAILDGFTVTGGNANDTVSSQHEYGGGMYINIGNPGLNNLIFSDNHARFGGGIYVSHTEGGDIAIDLGLSNVVFRNNTASGEGGGMATLFRPDLSSASFHLSLTDVIFENNTAARTGGGLINNGGELELVNVIFSGNIAAGGGGLSNILYKPSVLTNVTFHNNFASDGGGGLLIGAGGPIQSTLTNVTFSNNSTDRNGGGIGNAAFSNLLLTNVTFRGNTAGENGGGIFNGAFFDVEGGGTLDLINTTFSNNTANSNGGAIYSESGAIHIQNSILYGDTGGEFFDNAGTAAVTYSIVQGGYAGVGNLDEDPLLGLLADNGGFTQTMALGAGSPAIDAGDDANCTATDQRGVTRPQGAACDIGAYENQLVIRYVKWNASGANNGTSWIDAYSDLQTALSAASSDDEIWVAAGTYKPTTGTDRTVSFALKNGVAVYGGFSGTETSRNQRDPAANITILSGDLNGDDNDNILDNEPTRAENTYHVVTGGNGTNNTAVLDGFTITAGNANSFSEPNGSGAGIYSANSDPTLINLTFIGNSALVGGGMGNYQSSPTLLKVTFNGNTADCGGGMYNTNSSPSLTDVTFTANSVGNGIGGGMCNENGSNPILTNVTFKMNMAAFGGGMWNGSSSPSLTNVTFSGNTAIEHGGAILNQAGSNPILRNVTLSGNVAYNNQTGIISGGIFNSQSNPIIINSILWGNSGYQIDNQNSSAPVVTHSIVQGGYPGTGNLDVDPLLGPLQDNGGFTQTMALGASSPAIDSGDDTNCPATDQRGVTRPQGAACDIGAYEYEPPYANVDVNIAGSTVGSYYLPLQSGQRYGFVADDGPAQVVSTNGLDIIAALRVIWQEPGVRTSYSEMMGLPVEQLSDEYWFPWYNNVDAAAMNQGFRIANVDDTDTTIKVMLGATQLDSFTLVAGDSVRVNYAVNSGPIQIYSVEGNHILAALRVIWQEPGQRYSYSEMMGLPVEQLSKEYWFPWYNNLDAAAMNQGFRIASVNATGTNTIEVRVGDTLQDSFSLAAGTSVRVSYPVNTGPVRIVCTTCSGDEKIVTSLRVIWQEPGFRATYSEMMGLPLEQLSKEYWFPWYNNVDAAAMNQGFRIANVNATSDNTIQVWVGDTMQDSFTLLADASLRLGYPVNSGPIRILCTTCSGNERIITSLRVIWQETGIRTSYSEMMGLPTEALSTQYWFPWYNNAFPAIMNQGFRISIP